MNITNIYSGTVIIDQKLNIISVKDEKIEFLQEIKKHTFALVIHPEDIECVEKAVKKSFMEGMAVCAARFRFNGVEFEWGFVVLTKKAGIKDDEVVAYIFKIDSSEKSDNLKILENDVKQYFTLMDCLMFSYDKKSDKLKIFSMGDTHSDFYDGTLSDWQNTLISNHAVDDMTLGAFIDTCDAFRNGSPEFEYDLKMRIFNNSEKKEWCTIKGKTITNSEGCVHTIATTSKVAAVGNEDNPYGNSDFLDSGISLFNKKAITEYAENLIKSRISNSVTLGIIDIDNFKNVNDQYGHKMGDDILQKVASVLKDAVGNNGIAGRIGGDEMIVVLREIENEEKLRDILRYIRNNVSYIYHQRPDRPHITCSIGVASYPEAGDDYANVFEVADKMLYLAKQKGKNRYIMYKPELHEDYVTGRGMIKSDEYLFYKYKKISVVNMLVNAFKKDGKECLDEMADKIAFAFALDSIYIYMKNKNGSFDKITASGEEKNEDASFLCDDAYLPSFSAEGIFVIDNVNYSNNKVVKAYDAIKRMGICQAVQVEFGDGDIYVSFNRNKQLSKWSESDIIYLAIIGNIFAGCVR